MKKVLFSLVETIINENSGCMKCNACHSKIIMCKINDVLYMLFLAQSANRQLPNLTDCKIESYINVGRMFRTDQKCPYLHANN